MFISNGIVYGSSPHLPINVEQVKVLPDRMMLIRFNNGETRLFDTTLLQGAVYEPLRDQEILACPEISHGIVTWLDGEIDCAPEYMYDHSYEYPMVG